jgi:D-alanyl-D-alanine carboxypeptidase
MVSTHYDNPNGLTSPGQITTPRDLAVLARALWLDFPDHRDLFGIPAIKAGNRVLPSENVLLERYPGAVGMKTGFVCAAGYNIIGMANRSGRQLMVVVLGARSAETRAEMAAVLLNRGFDNAYGGSAQPQLASFDATPSTTPVANLRAQVCAPGGVPEDPDVLLTSVGATAALGPPTKVMAPVPVYTGHADVAEGDIKAAAPAAPRNVPLPRLRPTAGLAAPRVYAAQPTPATIASDPPLDLTQMH